MANKKIICFSDKLVTEPFVWSASLGNLSSPITIFEAKDSFNLYFTMFVAIVSFNLWLPKCDNIIVVKQKYELIVDRVYPYA